jgi:hypothetical protein
MVPRLIQNKLSGLRWRERGLRFSWRSAVWLLLGVTGVAIAFAVDWIVDLREDVPRALRTGLVMWEVGLAILAVLVLVFWPWSRKLDDESLALFVEDKKPELDHRLISTVQLNRPEADTRGMSPGLIQRLTNDTEQTVKPMSFAALADHRWLAWSALVVVPVVLVVAAVFLLMPETAMALLNRQLGGDDDIPRRVHIQPVAFDRHDKMIYLEPDQNLVKPLGEDVVLYFVATGVNAPEQSQGEVKLILSDGIERLRPLTFQRRLDDTHFLYSTVVQTPLIDFQYRAWLGDGRTRIATGVHMEPRPTVNDVQTVLQMPSEYKLNPNRKMMKGGDVIGLTGSTAIVRIAVQPGKRLESATLEPLERPLQKTLPFLRGGLGLAPSPLALAVDLMGQSATQSLAEEFTVSPTSVKTGMGPEFGTKPIKLTILPQGNLAIGEFPVEAHLTGFRIHVRDQYGFENIDVPRRSVQVVEDAVPIVELLPERLGNTYAKAKRPEAIIDDGFAVANDADNPDRTIRLAYRCSDDHGLNRAQLRYRLIPRGLEFTQRLAEVEPEFVVVPGFGLTMNPSSAAPLGQLCETVVGLGVINAKTMKAVPGDWIPLPLVEYERPKDGLDVGNFDMDLGIFEQVKDFKNAQINFHAVPALTQSDPRKQEALFDAWKRGLVDGAVLAVSDQWGRLDGGGRFDFHMNSLKNLQPGDRLEFFIEVFDNHPDTVRLRREPGRSEPRLKILVTEAEFQVAMRHREEQERKLRDLEKKQGDVFMTPRKP